MLTFQPKALLFDLDGTLVDSIAAVDRAWRTWAVEFGLDPEFVAPRIHGRRAIDSIRALAPHLDEEQVFSRLEHLEATDTEGVVALPGLHDFLASLGDLPWGIVTSGTRAIAVPRLAAAGIQEPEVFVTAELVGSGKPHPDPFLRGASLLGIAPSSIVAFEDTKAGVHSAQAAGMKVVALTLDAASIADAYISDFSRSSLTYRQDSQELHVH